MAQKCVHKGCGKKFDDPDEECTYHSGPPVFHEGQKGWSCCKPRVLTFDEFLSIAPCTTGRHSTVDDAPKPEPSQTPEVEPPVPPKAVPKLVADGPGSSRAPIALPTQAPVATQTEKQVEESESDDPSQTIPANLNCKRRGCNTSSGDVSKTSRDGETCIYHPGQPLFHEGSKGWTCCRRRVLEFDEFLKIEGCKEKSKHLYLGKTKSKEAEEEEVKHIRHDYYQTASTVIASLFLKKVDKTRAHIDFPSPNIVSLDLHTSDNKRYEAEIPLFGTIDPSKSTYKIMGTKVELNLVKDDGRSWPALRSDDHKSNDIIQVGQAARA